MYDFIYVCTNESESELGLTGEAGCAAIQVIRKLVSTHLSNVWKEWSIFGQAISNSLANYLLGIFIFFDLEIITLFETNQYNS